MLKTKNLHGECQNCGGPIEFLAEHAGSTADCPHCGQVTELLLAAPPEEASPVRRKAIVFAIVAMTILGGGLFAANVALKRAKRLQAQQLPPSAAATPPAANPFATQGLKVSAVNLESEPGSAMIYAVGTVVEISGRQRFGIKVELELRGADGGKVGEANDYQKVLEPKAEWRFRALVPSKQAVSAKIVAIREMQ